MIKKYPNVQFLQLPKTAELPALLAAAISCSKGEIIAITDSACTVAPDWISAVINAHKGKNVMVVGGAVEIIEKKKRKRLDWAAYFCDYAAFMRPLENGFAETLPGNNISFRREAMLIGKQFGRNEFLKTFWCRELQKNGIRLMADSSIRVFYEKEFNLLPFIIGRFKSGRDFAASRRERELGRIKSLVFSFGTVLLPIIFFYRLLSTVLSKKRHLKEFLLSLPFTAAAVLFWSVGEFCGYLIGRKKKTTQI